jgi:hypothetical protein
MMKKMKLMNAVFAVMMAFVMSGCDKDSVKALVLDGTWTGYIETVMQNRWGLSGKEYRTAMYFKQEGLYGGYGCEVDYDTRSRYADYYYSDFRWEVSNGVIYIRYADSWNTTVQIYDYSLQLWGFSGYMDDGTSRQIRFELVPESNFDWSYYWDRDSYYYAPTRGMNEQGGRYHASGVFKEKMLERQVK